MDPSAAPPPRAKIQLLVRREDEQGFEVREVGSGLAFVQSRPQRVVEDGHELVELASRVGAQRLYILKNRKTERYVLLTEHERFLWDRMDGQTSVQEIATAYVLTYGEFDFDIIPNLMRKLQHAQLLTLTPTSRLRKALARHRRRQLVRMLERALTGMERATVASRRVHPAFQWLYRWGGFLLFSRVALVAWILLGIAGIAAGASLWPRTDAVVAGLGVNPVAAVLSVKVLLLVTVGLHQIVHGLALVHYGRRVREFGFTFLHGFIPTFYIDVTDIFMASRRARVVTAVSGALVHLVVGSLWLLLAAKSGPGFVQAFAATSGIVQLQAFAVALYPFCFIEMDGYHVLVDVLGVPMLKNDALSYVRSVLRGARRPAWTREEWLWLGYVGLSAISVAGFVAFNVSLILHAAR